MTLIAASLGFAVVQLDVSVVNVAVKSIGVSFGGAVSDLQWVISAYTVAFAAFILTGGAVADRTGARRVFVGGFAVFTAASVVCGLAPSLLVLIGARAVQGSGAAMLVPASLSLLNHAYPDPHGRARAVGLYLAVAATALSGGPLIGGALIASLGWRAIFFINVPIAVAGVFSTLRWASETPRARGRSVDLAGQATAVITLTALVGATIEGGRNGFGQPLILAGFAVAIVGAIGFVTIEARSAEPMLPLSLFRSRTFTVSTVMGLLINTCFYGLIFLLSLLFQREQHLSPLQTGLALLPMTIAITVANLVAGWTSRRIGPGGAVAVGALLIGAAAAGLLGVEASTPYGEIVGQTTLLGFGTGLGIAVITNLTLGSVDQSRSGIAGGTLNTARQTGSAIGVAVFGSLIAATFIAGLHLALAISVALMLAVTGLTQLLARRPLRSRRRKHAPGGRLHDRPAINREPDQA
jgi:DHA2 family methylenomycin A resistance protein-like MFS transporter